MKRAFFAVIFSFAMLLTAAACSSNDTDKSNGTEEPEEIEYTAERPVFEFDYSGFQMLINFTNRGQADDYDVFGEFYSYYCSRFKNTVDYDFYLLNPGDDILGWLPDCLYKEFQILESKDESDYSVIYEYLMLRDEELFEMNSADDEVLDGESNSNINLSIYLLPVSGDVAKTDYRLEFGNNYDGYYTEYINIYVNQSCIATCYITTESQVTYSWFSKYFKKNLFRA